MRTSFQFVAESAFRQLYQSNVKWHIAHLADPHLPRVSCVDRLSGQMAELQAANKEQLRKSTISAPIWLTNAAWGLSPTSPPSALVVRSISFHGNPGFCTRFVLSSNLSWRMMLRRPPSALTRRRQSAETRWCAGDDSIRHRCPRFIAKRGTFSPKRKFVRWVQVTCPVGIFFCHSPFAVPRPALSTG
jgi:hypothetical protein